MTINGDYLKQQERLLQTQQHEMQGLGNTLQEKKKQLQEAQLKFERLAKKITATKSRIQILGQDIQLDEAAHALIKEIEIAPDYENKLLLRQQLITEKEKYEAEKTTLESGIRDLKEKIAITSTQQEELRQKIQIRQRELEQARSRAPSAPQEESGKIIHRAQREVEQARLPAQAFSKQQLVARLKPLLATYLDDRGHRYRHKDLFFSKDKRQRQKLANVLRQKLDDYAQGMIKSDVLVEWIRTERQHAPGKKLPTLLNKIIVSVLDNDGDKRSYLDKAKEAAGIVYQLKQNSEENGPYLMKLEKLEKKIDKLRTKGVKSKDESMIALANALKSDLDEFTLSSPTAETRNQHFQAFAAKFEDRLNSESFHLQNWPAITANIFIGVLSLGTALIGKLVHSKLTQGHATLFLSSHRGPQEKNSMEADMAALIPAPTKGR